MIDKNLRFDNNRENSFVYMYVCTFIYSEKEFYIIIKKIKKKLLEKIENVVLC